MLVWSPYLVQDDPWMPLLCTHRASFHDEAAQLVTDLLAALSDDEVRPTAELDVARLTDHRFVLLETNHVWAAGLYGGRLAGAVDGQTQLGRLEPDGRAGSSGCAALL